MKQAAHSTVNEVLQARACIPKVSKDSSVSKVMGMGSMVRVQFLTQRGTFPVITMPRIHSASNKTDTRNSFVGDTVAQA